MSFDNKIKEFEKRKETVENYPEESVKKQHGKGKLTARERIKLLVDPGSFVEMDTFVNLKSHNFDLQKKKQDGDGVVTGCATINKRLIYLYSQDFTIIGGSLGEMHADKIVKVLNLARKTGAPFIALNDSGGARIQEGINSLDGYAKIFKANSHASGIIPQITAILGPCAGGAVYSPALMDIVFMVKDISNMFITGPAVIKSVTGEEIDFNGLGGASTHNKKSGVAHFMCEDEKECIAKIRKLISYLPSNNLNNPPVLNTQDSPTRLNEKIKDFIPNDSQKSYDVKDIINDVVDKASFFEVHKNYAQNAVVGFARLNNYSIGIIANQPKVLAGCLDIDCSDKIARFVRFCDCFNIPIINFVDVPGYLPGVNQEHNGIIRHGAKMLYAYSEATVPKIALVMRKAYGGAYIAMCSKDIGYDQVIAWPSAEIAVMGSEQAVNIIYKKDIKSSKKKEKIEEFDKMFLNPYVAAEQGKVDIIIDPKYTRQTLIKTLLMLMNKREKSPARKHGNIPL